MVRNGWTLWHLLGALVLMLAGLAATWDAWADMYRIASVDEEHSHIFLVPFVSGWLVWVRRGRLRLCVPRATWVGPLIVACGWLLHSVGDSYMIQSFWHLGAVAVVVGAVLAVTGKDLLTRFIPAFVVLAFLGPVPGMLRQEIAIPLQAATAQVTQTVLDTIGVAVTRSGNVLSINGVDVAIAEACNGLRMVFALALVSFAFAYGTPLRGGVRILVLVASPISAVLCNVFRLVPTVWLYGSAEAAVADRMHDISGWVMLPIAFLFLLGILRILRWAQIPVTRYVLAYGS